jgi:hypothetical protein
VERKRRGSGGEVEELKFRVNGKRRENGGGKGGFRNKISKK